MNYFRGKSVKTGKWLYGYLGKHKYTLVDGKFTVRKNVYLKI